MEAIAVELAIEAVKFLVGRFIQQLDEQKLLIDEAAVRLEELERDNKFLTEYLEDAIKKPKSNNLIDRTLLREVRDSVYKAEDAIDSFAFKVADRESKWYSGIKKSAKPVVEIAQLIKSVAESVNKIRQKVEERDKDTAHATDNEGLPEYEGEPPIQEYGPIFAEEEKRLRQRLIGEAKQPDVIFITGTHGIGKTTLAAKMFHDSKMRKQDFNKHIWVSVHNPTPKNILLVVLRRLNKLPDDVPIPKILWELCDQVASCLTGEKFLLVIDNVPEMSKDDFKRLRSAFGQSDKRSKILITSNNDDLAAFVADDSHIKLNPLELGESWSLLQWRVFSGGPCPPGLERPGKLIAANCNGLPQKIDFAGDALAEKDRHSKEPGRRKKEWDDFSEGIIPFTPSSYNKMPYHLRACFLYLGIFPRKSKFSVSKLAHMWIAEGFIPRKDGVTLEETAEEYLKELVKRNLVSIEEKRLDGSAKTCSINELIYNFCKKESAADGENFLQEFRNSGPEGFYPPIDEVKKNRRVCIHAHISKFIETLISSRHQTLKIGLRSFVSHSDTEVTLHGKNISIIRAAFKLLRVLDAKPIKVNKIHSDLCLLVHLRYVTLSLNGDVLPEAISKLRNMQTLTVHTTSCTLKIEADILKMVELRHFQTNASATLPKKSKASEEDERLQTLCGISPKSCTQEFFSKLPNLKKLGICGQLGLLLLDGKNELLSKLVKVEKLKLLNQVTSPKDEDDLSKLFDQPPRFPPNLRSLTLSATSLDWKHISILGSLQELEELKLKNDAFVGDKWEVHDEGFPNLKTLKIESLHLIHWKSTSAHFPKLKRLMLSKCEKLREIPVELADISTFQELHLRNANQSAIECANDILADKLHMKQNDNNIMFELLFDD